MLQSLIYNLKNPHKIPIKIIKKIIFFYKKIKYDEQDHHRRQIEKFKNFNLDRSKAKSKLNTIIDEYIFLKREMSSEHELLFSALSINKDIDIKNILEIGTFDGANAFLMSKLFKNSQVDTIDLKSDEKEFLEFYNRKKNVQKFIDDRNKLLSKSKNIKFEELNSVRLTNSQKKYDLIWIDGAHGYPVCCIDIINSIRLITDQGYILVDDVSLENYYDDKMYRSIAGFDTLKELEKNEIIKFSLFYKRLDSESNCDTRNIKYIALVKKNYSK